MLSLAPAFSFFKWSSPSMTTKSYNLSKQMGEMTNSTDQNRSCKQRLLGFNEIGGQTKEEEQWKPVRGMMMIKQPLLASWRTRCRCWQSAAASGTR